VGEWVVVTVQHKPHYTMDGWHKDNNIVTVMQTGKQHISWHQQCHPSSRQTDLQWTAVYCQFYHPFPVHAAPGLHFLPSPAGPPHSCGCCRSSCSGPAVEGSSRPVHSGGDWGPQGHQAALRPCPAGPSPDCNTQPCSASNWRQPRDPGGRRCWWCAYTSYPGTRGGAG
jgi:hypothetical protein